MKISEITLDYAKEYLRVYDNEDNVLIGSLLETSISYIKNYTGLDAEGIESKEELTTAVMLLTSDFYDNRSGSVDSNTKVNMALKSILDMHSVNLL